MAYEAELDGFYGDLPFDCYVEKHWDFTLPVGQDSEQWKSLVRSYLNLGRRERLPYHDAALTNQSKNDESYPPTPEVINRCFLPFQTAVERGMCAEAGMGNLSLIRTCYNPDLAQSYSSLVNLDVIEDRELNDAQLYDGLDLDQIILRIPQFLEPRVYSVMEDIEDEEQEESERDPPYQHLQQGSFEKAVRDERCLLLIADEEAMRQQLLKVKWIDMHGHCVWENKISPGRLETLKGLRLDGQSLEDFASDEYGHTILP